MKLDNYPSNPLGLIAIFATLCEAFATILFPFVKSDITDAQKWILFLFVPTLPPTLIPPASPRPSKSPLRNLRDCVGNPSCRRRCSHKVPEAYYPHSR